MRKSALFVAALFMLGLTAGPTNARVITDLGGGWNQGKLGYACGKAGGQYYDNGNGTYGCVKDGCKKGASTGENWCAVQCNGDKCQGNTPGMVKVNPGRGTVGGVRAVLGGGVIGSEGPAKPKPGLTAPGILETKPGFATTGPAPTGSPLSSGAPAAPAGPLR